MYRIVMRLSSESDPASDGCSERYAGYKDGVRPPHRTGSPDHRLQAFRRGTPARETGDGKRETGNGKLLPLRPDLLDRSEAAQDSARLSMGMNSFVAWPSATALSASDIGWR